MALFEHKRILLGEEAVSEQLRREREAKEISLVEAARRLKIKPAYLSALEEGRFNALPQGVYVKTFLREYSLFLGLDYKRVLKAFEAEKSIFERERGDVFERKVVSKRYLLTLPVIVRNAIIGFLIIACLTYLGILLKQIFEPPELAIDYPPADLKTAEQYLVVTGRSEPETEVTINGQSVLVDSEGSFEREIYLQTGLNTITVTSEKKYSRSATVSRQVLVE